MKKKAKAIIIIPCHPVTKIERTERGRSVTKITVPGPYKTLESMRIANKRAGYSYFDPEIMRLFGSRPSRSIRGRFFIDSCTPPSGSRIAKVCAVTDTGDIVNLTFPPEAPGERDEIDEEKWFASNQEARKALRWLLDEVAS